MKPITLALILSLTLLPSFTAKACSCINFFKWDNLSDFDKYEFIALVKITDADDQQENPNILKLDGHLQFKIIELFKGRKLTSIIEADKNSSCDMGIETGEEWLIYGVRCKKELFIQACDRNKTYKDKNELIDWHYADALDELNALRKLFHHPAPVFPDGERTHFYSNGQLELKENYSNGVLNGERKIWYPNGILYTQQYYLNGQLDGKTEWYYPSGQLEEEENFRNGINSKISKIYYDATLAPYSKDTLKFVSNRIQVEYERLYDTSGQLILTRIYDRVGTLTTEEINEYPQNLKTTLNYNQDGSLKSIWHAQIHYKKDP